SAEVAAQRELERALAEVEQLQLEGAPAASLTRHLNRAIELSADPGQRADLRRRVADVAEREEAIALARRLNQELVLHNAVREDPRRAQETAERLRGVPRESLPPALAEELAATLGVYGARVELYGVLERLLRAAGDFQAGQEASRDYFLLCERLGERYPEVRREGLEIKLQLLEQWEAFMPHLVGILRGLTLNRLDRPADAQAVFQRAAQLPGSRAFFDELVRDPTRLFSLEELGVARRMMGF
ncbi:MAG: hypothetical protein KDD82_28350, partial [Planctomycetes bacterium]|nr:hypothetical protein [Planctomycetota bacterium]